MIKNLLKKQVLTTSHGEAKQLGNKAFTLIELLAVIVILAVVALVATPIIMTTVSNAKKSAASSSTLGYIKAINNAIGLAELEGNNPLPDGTYSLSELTSKIDVKVQGKGPTDGIVKITDGIVSTANFNIDDFYVAYDSTGTKVIGKVTGTNTSVYKEELLAGSYPIYSTNLIPVVIANDGSVTKADITTEWYKYAEKKWANAVILKDEANSKYDESDYGTEIDLEDIESYFVWIPKYSYKIFNLDTSYYSSGYTKETLPQSNAQEIEITFGTTNTTDTDETCATPMVSGEIGECSVEKLMTHPAFISMNTNGFWVAKFETTGTTESLSVLPDEISLTGSEENLLTVKKMFELAYNYKRNNDSHMMKNTEWGAVAYLSHSKYGFNNEVNMNNYVDEDVKKTGYSAVVTPTCFGNESCNIVGSSDDVTQPYNTEIGYTASTTGNITGVYDMSGGAAEYMAAYGANLYGNSGFDTSTISKYNSKYFDIYSGDLIKDVTQYDKMILGDATGEMGPFYQYDEKYSYMYYNNWYTDYSAFIPIQASWVMRSGYPGDGYFTGQFYFGGNNGDAGIHRGFRLVLTN